MHMYDEITEKSFFIEFKTCENDPLFCTYNNKSLFVLLPHSFVELIDCILSLKEYFLRFLVVVSIFQKCGE